MMRLRNQKGLTLIEVIIALAVLGMISASIFMALNVSLRTTASTNERTIAESLTRSELEYIKNCPYDDSGNPSYAIDPNIDLTSDPYYGRYSITVIAKPIDPVTHDDLEIPPDDDLGIQKITVEVYHESPYTHEDRVVVTTTSFKVAR